MLRAKGSEPNSTTESCNGSSDESQSSATGQSTDSQNQSSSKLGILSYLLPGRLTGLLNGDGSQSSSPGKTVASKVSNFYVGNPLCTVKLNDITAHASLLLFETLRLLLLHPTSALGVIVSTS